LHSHDLVSEGNTAPPEEEEREALIDTSYPLNSRLCCYFIPVYSFRCLKILTHRYSCWIQCSYCDQCTNWWRFIKQCITWSIHLHLPGSSNRRNWNFV